MSDNVKNRVKELLESGKIRGFLGLRRKNGHVGPHLFTKEDDLADLVLGDGEKAGDSRYPLNKQLIHLPILFLGAMTHIRDDPFPWVWKDAKLYEVAICSQLLDPLHPADVHEPRLDFRHIAASNGENDRIVVGRSLF